MASRKKKKGKQKRPTESYLASAKNLSNIVPRLRKYRKRKTLTRYEKSAITRREKQLKGVTHLFPVSKKQAKRLKKKLFAHGIQAIRLRNVEPGAKFTVDKRGDLIIREGNTRWIYWSLDRQTVRSRRGMRKAGEDAFNKKFPIEKVSDLARIAFDKLKVQQVHLWTHAGIASEGFLDIGAFIRWVNEKWNAGRYIRIDQITGLEDSSDPGNWVNGIAILIENPEYTRKRKTANVPKTT